MALLQSYVIPCPSSHSRFKSVFYNISLDIYTAVTLSTGIFYSHRNKCQTRIPKKKEKTLSRKKTWSVFNTTAFRNWAIRHEGRGYWVIQKPFRKTLKYLNWKTRVPFLNVKISGRISIYLIFLKRLLLEANNFQGMRKIAGFYSHYNTSSLSEKVTTRHQN